ncbi:hypothetical protein PVK06_041210 [Gossypium arboreum]|uniref:Uncharacterized protein n=1 Tax=Gossypium arboreum TaxID=29729 RepID=A0ABR0N7K9_GOSAR|nr:hypothetical protein PVK06_041210 [Gossypium arboreum]
MAGRWATAAFRWVFSDLISVRRWPTRWGHVEWPQLSGFSFSIVDDVVWSLITAFESVALDCGLPECLSEYDVSCEVLMSDSISGGGLEVVRFVSRRPRDLIE